MRKLVVFDDGQGLEGLPKADAVRNDASAQPLQFVDGADDAVALELEKFPPNNGVADAGGGLDDALLVQFVSKVLEEMVEGEVVDERRVPSGPRFPGAGTGKRLSAGRTRADAFQRFVNHEPRRADSSARSEHWIRLNWLPGVMPKPSVVKAQLPVMTR